MAQHAKRPPTLGWWALAFSRNSTTSGHLTLHMRAFFLTLLLVISRTTSHGAATDPGQNGPFAWAKQTVSIPGTQGATLSTDVYFPAVGSVVDPAATPCPAIVLGHGFLQAKDQHVNHGKHLATRGFVVLIPNFNGGSDHSRNADDLIKLVDWIVGRQNDAQSVFFHALRIDRIGATGHSAGGLSAILATSRDPRIRALAPMDPVDNSGLGVAALPTITVPVGITYSEPQSCNSNGSAATLFNAAVAPKRGMKVVGADHSDAQDPAGFSNVLLCGGANATRQMLYRRYTAGWFEYYLHGDASYSPWVFNLPGGQVLADVAANRMTYSAALPASPIAHWRSREFGTNAGNPAIAANDADPDGDGAKNLLEYAFNLDPLVPAQGGLPQSTFLTVAQHQYQSITFSRVATATDLLYQVEVSSDLLNWLPGASYAGAGSTQNTPNTTEVSRSGIGVETIVVRDNSPTDISTKRFIRLRITPQ